jgi:radical SAM protein with 4Fe4S-binding SPASM domain
LDPEPRVRRDRSGGRPELPAGEPLAEPVAARLEAIAEAAREAGVNVTFGDFPRPPVRVRVVPTRLDGLMPPEGVCWNVAVNFAVQFDGSVYPCCHPTDYRLGNVLDSTIEGIWNGPVAQRLRQAHLARRRVAFCTGCIEAPYLGAARATAAWSERARLGLSHHGNTLRTALRRHAAGRDDAEADQTTLTSG